MSNNIINNKDEAILLVGAGYMAKEYAKVLLAQKKKFIVVGRGEESAKKFKEEIGIDIDMQDVQFYKVMNRKVNKQQEYVDFIFKANHWTGEITNEESNKCEEIIWVNKEKIPENTLSFIPQMLENDKSAYLPYNWEES